MLLAKSGRGAVAGSMCTTMSRRPPTVCRRTCGWYGGSNASARESMMRSSVVGSMSTRSSRFPLQWSGTPTMTMPPWVFANAETALAILGVGASLYSCVLLSLWPASRNAVRVSSLNSSGGDVGSQVVMRVRLP